jgi:hypothetical protein
MVTGKNSDVIIFSSRIGCKSTNTNLSHPLNSQPAHSCGEDPRVDAPRRIEDVALDVLNYRLDSMEPYLVRWSRRQRWKPFRRDGLELLLLDDKIVPELSEYLLARDHLDLGDGTVITFTHEIELFDIDARVVRFVKLKKREYLAVRDAERS